MSNEIVPQAFESQEFGTIRTATRDGVPMFCAKDVAVALGYQNTNDAIKKHCRGVAICYPITDGLGRTQNARFITEGDMYRLIASSKLESAQRFESWVFDEVIPSIRRDGAYVASDGTEDDSTLMARALIAAQRAIDRNKACIAELEAKVAEQAPKAGMFDACMDGERWMSVTEVSRLLRQYDKTMTRRRLDEVLMDSRMMTRDRQASAEGIERGYVRNYQPPAFFNQSTGEMVRPKAYAKLTSKGLDWLVRTKCGREVA